MQSAAIRRSQEVELSLISALEKSGDAKFRAAGMSLVADAPAPDPSEFVHSHQAGRLLVACDAGGALIAFVRIEVLDDEPHIQQLSVHPDHQGHGVGRALLHAAEQWAQAHGYTRMTLTTFEQVPWNGPYYSRLGWAVSPETDWGADLAAARRYERDLALDQWPRQAMVKALGTE